MDQSPTVPSMNRPKHRIALVFLALAMLCVGGLLVLPWLLNRPATLERLSREFEQRTGHSLSVEGWQVRLFPSIGLELSQPRVQDPAATTPLLVADRLEVTLQWLPLLEGRVIGKDLIIDRPRLTIRRAVDGTWSPAAGKESVPADDSAPPLALLQAVPNVLMVDGLITVVDDSGLTPRVPVQIRVAQGTLSSEMLGRHAKLQVSGEIPQEPNRAAFTWDGSLTQNQDGGGIQSEGDLRVHHIDVRHLLSSWAGVGLLSDGFAEAAQLTAHLRWSPRHAGYEFIADGWRIELADMSVQGTAAILGLGTEHATFSSTLSARPVSFGRLLYHIPSVWIPAPLQAQLAAHGVEGLITVQSMSLSGEIASGSRPIINGLVEIRNGHFTLNPQYPSVEAFSANISYDAAQMRITDLRAQCGPLRLRAEDLFMTQWMTDPHIDVNILGTASLAGLLEAAGRIEEFPLLRDILTNVEQATGDVEMIAHVSGQPAGGKQLALVDVDVMLHRGGFRSVSLPKPVRLVEARIKATPTVVAIDHLDGWLGPAKFHTHGVVSVVGNRAHSDVKIRMNAEASDVKSLFAENAEGEFRPEMEGAIYMQAALTGPIDAPRLKGTVDLQQAALRIPNRLTKPLHAPAAIEFDGGLSHGNRLVVRHLDVRLPPIKIVGDGTVDLTGDMEFAANVSSGTVSVSKLPRGVTLGLFRAGTLGAALHSEGRLKERASWRTSGEVRLDSGMLVVEGLQEPIREAFVTLRFDQDRIQIPRMAFHVGASDFRVSGSVAHWADTPKARLVVESSQIDVATFSPSSSPSSRSQTDSTRQRSPGNAWWSDATLNLFLFADHVYYKKFLLTDLSTRVVWDHGLLTVERISGDTNEGHVSGQVKIRAAGRRIEQARSTFRVNGIPIDRVLSQFQEKPVLSGWLTTSGKLQAEVDRAGFAVGAVASRRPIQIVVEDGRIYDVPVISTLLSVMNLPALLQGQVDLEKDGLPLDRLKVVFSLTNGVINAKEFLLDSPILKISGTGRYDILADEFDMVLATSPLGSYSTMLKRIPLFGQLLAGDRQGFDTAVFELKGSANKPNLRYLPTESLMVGVKGTAQLAFDMLVNAITLPQKAYSMVEESITGSEDEEF